MRITVHNKIIFFAFRACAFGFDKARCFSGMPVKRRAFFTFCGKQGRQPRFIMTLMIERLYFYWISAIDIYGVLGYDRVNNAILIYIVFLQLKYCCLFIKICD